jgi:GMP synthase (glutamine-hydrolysing)
MSERRILCLQHVPFEGPAIIHNWAIQKGHEFKFTRLFRDEKTPGISSVDWIVVMGGPMSVHDHMQFPWLTKEIEFIRQAIEESKVVIGICLGAQLVAKAMGAKVIKGKQKEIGWFPVQVDIGSARRCGLDFLPRVITPFHWHQDTFDIPDGAVPFASSEAFTNQAFVYDERVLALQFHFEMDLPAIGDIIQHSGNDLVPGKYVQSAESMLGNRNFMNVNHKLMYKILDHLETLKQDHQIKNAL